MPNRWLALAITSFWVVMMGLLLERDVLPHWKIRHPPDLRAVSEAIPASEPVRWGILQNDRRIGWVETEWDRRPDGWSVFQSRLELKEPPPFSMLGLAQFTRGLRWSSAFHITPDGNLDHFELDLFLAETKPTWTVRGRVDKGVMRVAFRSSGFVHEEQFYYEPRTMMTTSLAPIDKLPNLRIGHTWEYRVMNPLRSTTEMVRCQVVGEQVITWKGDPVPTHLVEQHHGKVRARCWVAHDGTVLRQEVPLGWTPLLLEHE